MSFMLTNARETCQLPLAWGQLPISHSSHYDIAVAQVAAKGTKENGDNLHAQQSLFADSDESSVRGRMALTKRASW